MEGVRASPGQRPREEGGGSPPGYVRVERSGSSPGMTPERRGTPPPRGQGAEHWIVRGPREHHRSRQAVLRTTRPFQQHRHPGLDPGSQRSVFGTSVFSPSAFRPLAFGPFHCGWLAVIFYRRTSALRLPGRRGSPEWAPTLLGNASTPRPDRTQLRCSLVTGVRAGLSCSARRLSSSLA